MTSPRFEGKTAVVTGAASGIGRAIAGRFDAEGGTGDIDENGARCRRASPPHR